MFNPAKDHGRRLKVLAEPQDKWVANGPLRGFTPFKPLGGPGGNIPKRIKAPRCLAASLPHCPSPHRTAWGGNRTAWGGGKGGHSRTNPLARLPQNGDDKKWEEKMRRSEFKFFGSVHPNESINDAPPPGRRMPPLLCWLPHARSGVHHQWTN